MKGQSSALSPAELTQIDVTSYTHCQETLVLYVIVRRQNVWHTALVCLETGKVVYSQVNPEAFRIEAAARAACQQECERMSHRYSQHLLPR